MRSVLLATLDYPPRKGGVATFLANFVECFPRGAVHVLAVEEGDTHKLDVGSDHAIYRRRLLMTRLRPRWLTGLYWTDWLWRKEKPSMLLVSHLLPMGTVARLLKKHRKLPYGVIIHGMDLALAMHAGGGKLKEAKRVLAGADLVIANSAYTAALVKGVGVPESKVMVLRPSPGFPLYLTVDHEKVSAARAACGFGTSFGLLALGRLVARKGFADAISAVAELMKRGVDVRLCVAGDGPERTKLQKLAETKGIADRVRFLGTIADQDLPALYGACDAFITVPKSIGPDVEGFGIVYLEANVMGKPVIGSRAGGVPDAVIDGKTGLLVPPGDIAAIADAIERLVNDPALRQRLGEAGQRRVREDFGWRRQSRPVIERILGEHHG